MVAFGHEFRKKHFSLIGNDITLINHGFFGVTPTSVVEDQKKLTEGEEKYSDEFFFSKDAEEYVKQLKQLGSYLCVDFRNLALVTNATTAVNTVLRSIPWDFSKDKVLFHSTTYQACANTIEFLSDYFKLQYDVLELQYPLEDDEVLVLFEEKLSTGEYTLCLFDMISSMPGVKIALSTNHFLMPKT
ncbi:hypothetical protein ZYGR_0AK00100 [Zygosaccharomyces rouxii]|uniref:Aminotransferase class V domain-containing protein n=1 Tax=Zygosaccharomyces rouxii TaxID=4956 RepID=S6C5Z7_ZYGRO|nr:hypothetical protein [Zygosaccharomyces rouxii]GAV53508.1 hypothetical protein ZYGR_0AK00100 [Zygosaccharomyces rouxii]